MKILHRLVCLCIEIAAFYSITSFVGSLLSLSSGTDVSVFSQLPDVWLPVYV